MRYSGALSTSSQVALRREGSAAMVTAARTSSLPQPRTGQCTTEFAPGTCAASQVGPLDAEFAGAFEHAMVIGGQGDPLLSGQEIVDRREVDCVECSHGDRERFHGTRQYGRTQLHQ